MIDEDKTKEQRPGEMVQLNWQIVGLKTAQTKRKQMGKVLPDSEQQFRALIENAQDAIVIVNPDITIRYESPSMERMTGREAKDRIGKNPFDFCHPDDITKVAEAFIQLLENKIAIAHTELRLQHKNGRWLTFEVIGTNLIDNPLVAGIVLNLRDITERKRVEETLQESEERFRSMVENAPYMIIIADREGKILLINYTASGFNVEDTIGTSVYDYISVEYHDEVSRSINGIFESGEPAAYEITGAGPDGTTSWYSVRLGPIKHDGNIIAVTLMVLDITERKRMEQAMRESQEKLRIIFDSIGDGITVVDLAGNIIDVNETVMRIKGYSRKDVIGRYGLDFVAEKDRARAIDSMMNLLKGQEEQTPTMELSLLAKDGSEIPCEGSATLLRDSSGNIVGLISVERDITERKQVGEALRESEERYRMLVETMNDGLAAQDIDGIFTYVNDRLCEMLGFSRDELIGVHVMELLDEVSQNKYKEEIRRRRQGERVPYEIEFTRGDGSKVITRVSPQLITDQEGNPVGSFGVVTDITERKQVEEEMHESREKLRAMFESIGDAVVVSDLEGRIIEENEAALRMQGYSHKKEVIGRSGLELVAEKDRARVIEAISNALKLGYGPLGEFTFMDKNGRELCGEASAALLRDSSGNPEGFISVTRDITERKRAEEKLIRLSNAVRMSTDSIVISDLEAKIVEVNEATLRMYGTDEKGDLIGKNSYDLIAPEDREKAIASAIEVLERGYVENQEYHIITKDGSTVLVAMSTAIMKDMDGKPTGFVAVSRDITERKRAEEAIQESREKLRILFDTIGVGITVTDLAGNIVDVNETVLRMKGFSREDVIGRYDPDFVAEKDRARAVDEMMNLLKGQEEQSPTMELALLVKDGSEIPCEASATLLRDGSGNIVGLISIERDITERKNAEQQIRESEELLRAFMESATDVYTIFNSKLELLDVSEKGTKVFLPTAKREDMIGKHITEIVPDIKKTGRYQDYLNVIKTGKPFQVDDTIVHAKFAVRHVSLKAFKVRDGMGLVITDITERKRAEEKLIRLSNAVRMSTDSIVISDLEAKIVEVNESTLRMYGTDDKGDLIGKNAFDLITPEDREKALVGAKEVLERGYAENQEYHMVTKDGSTLLVAMDTAIMKDVDGKPTGFVAVSRDITDRKKAEEELRESEEFSTSLLDNAPNPILVINPDTTLRYVNPALEKLTGFSNIELVNRKAPYPWWTEETLEKTSKDFGEAMSKGAEGLEELFQKKNGERFWVEINSMPIRMHGELDHYLANWVDITERKKAEEELRHYSERLRVMAMQLSDAQDNERRRLAHELHDRVGQNLTALSINLSMVRTQLPEEAVAPVRSTLDDSQSILEQTAAIIRDVMSNLQPPVLEDYGLVAALRWYAERFASRTGISVTVQGEDPSPRPNTSSENSLFRIVQEALTNVAKHAQATQVTVTFVAETKTVRLVVTDDGIGFNTEDVVNSDVQQGWGLTTMSERAKSLGGSFDIESRPGHGTRVVVEIGR